MLATRGEGRHRRADVRALRAVDAGTDDEQRAEGHTVTYEQGERSSHLSLGSPRPPREEIDNRVVERRQREARIHVTPAPPDLDEPRE